MSTGVYRVALHILNSVHLIFGLAIAAASIWFFCEVHDFTTLRNSNHYLLDYNVYWPQAVPWMFFIVALFSIGAASCGFASTKRKSKSFLTAYIIMMSVVVLCLIGAAIVALVFGNSKSTENFVKDTVWDVYFQAKGDNEVATSFGVIERKLHCCGAESPRDYKNWKSEFPVSCCDVYYRGWLEPYALDCDFTNKLANERHGCSAVAVQYAYIAITVLSTAAIFSAIIGMIAIAYAVVFSRALEKRNRPPPQNEFESKKVLL